MDRSQVKKKKTITTIFTQSQDFVYICSHTGKYTDVSLAEVHKGRSPKNSGILFTDLFAHLFVYENEVI